MLIPLKDFDFTQRPMICAHRGDTSQGAAENTLAAVRDALTSGAEMVEIDIQFTTGGDIVCEHDPIAGKGNYERFEDVMKLVAGKLYLNIELKGYGVINEMPLIPKVLTLVDQYQMNAFVLYSSFRPEYVTQISKHAHATIIHPTNAMLGLGSKEKIEDVLPSELIRRTGATTYAAALEEMDERRMEDIKSNNIHLSVYTINTHEEFEHAVAVGAKGIVTDRPRNLVKFRREMFGL
ncbi:MAG TPA: glycerophosphodiester phosphodiesterase [Candidatus Kapabacteria bacterium]|nr:glycerophosphodiester phosphodiesterase [Candidatus Kapabacteria bacterium]